MRLSRFWKCWKFLKLRERLSSAKGTRGIIIGYSFITAGASHWYRWLIEVFWASTYFLRNTKKNILDLKAHYRQHGGAIAIFLTNQIVPNLLIFSDDMTAPVLFCGSIFKHSDIVNFTPLALEMQTLISRNAFEYKNRDPMIVSCYSKRYISISFSTWAPLK